MLKLTENNLLDEQTRKELIESFGDGHAMKRKLNAYKAYQCLKDKTKDYVLEQLLMQFENDTVYEMQYSVSNISILRKVISKLARVYNNGVKRTMPTDTETQMIEAMAKELDFNQVMKKANRYQRTFKNALVYVRPVKEEFDKMAVKVEVKAPFSYDVIEDPNDPTKPLAVILSDFIPPSAPVLRVPIRGGKDDDGTIYPRTVMSYSPTQAGVNEDDNREFIWWTKNFHFTTDAKGKIISIANSIDDVKNPLGVLPFVVLAEEQDGCFWAEGGEDLVEAGISINVMLTNTKHVGISQGYGQLYMSGKNLPKAVKVGPNHCVQMEYAEGEPTPAIGYLNSNPPLSDLKALIEMETALMLTTNNLSTAGFSTSLGSGTDFASGIALMIDKSESVEDVQEQAQLFIDEEPEIWALIGLWHGALKSAGVLVEDQAALPMPQDPSEVVVSFPSPKIPMSEKEELEVIEKRRDLGLNTEAELLMRDDPSLTLEEAEAKLQKIKDEKQAKMQDAVNAANAVGAPNGDQSQASGGDANQNNNDVGVDGGVGLAGKNQS